MNNVNGIQKEIAFRISHTNERRYQSIANPNVKISLKAHKQHRKFLAFKPSHCSTSHPESKEADKENIENTGNQRDYQNDVLSSITDNNTFIKSDLLFDSRDDLAVKEEKGKYDYTKSTRFIHQF